MHRRRGAGSGGRRRWLWIVVAILGLAWTLDLVAIWQRTNFHDLDVFLRAAQRVVSGESIYADNAAFAQALREGTFRMNDHTIVWPYAYPPLLAVTFVPAASTEPDLMLSVNVRGTLTLLDAFRSHAPYARILVVSSAHIYGPVHDEIPRREHDEPRPATLYAVSKMAADLAALAFAKREALAIMTARPTNHTGPGQPSRFVVPALARQVRAVAAGDRRDIVTGNLESVRDFADVRDVVRAYRLLLEGGKPRRAYNVSAGNRVPIRRILETLCGQANISPPVRTDPTLFRPVDHSPPLDTTRLRNAVRWSPTISLDATLRDMLCETPE